MNLMLDFILVSGIQAVEGSSVPRLGQRDCTDAKKFKEEMNSAFN